MSDTIIIGPDSIEMGWMLEFIGRARKKAEAYKNVIIYCEEGNEYLYEDFGTEYITFPKKKGWRDRWFFCGKRLDVPKLLRETYPTAKYYMPTRKHCVSDVSKFVKYGHEDDGYKFDVLIHARNIERGDWIDRVCGGNHNWGGGNYVELLKHLKGCSVASIGSRDGALHIKGTEDRRGIHFQALCGTMNKAKVIVGESSGPMHLASLCGLKHVVITHARPEKSIGGKNNKWRYRKGWNHLGTECAIIEHNMWRPSVVDVAIKTLRYL